MKSPWSRSIYQTEEVQSFPAIVKIKSKSQIESIKRQSCSRFNIFTYLFEAQIMTWLLNKSCIWLSKFSQKGKAQTCKPVFQALGFRVPGEIKLSRLGSHLGRCVSYGPNQLVPILDRSGPFEKPSLFILSLLLLFILLKKINMINGFFPPSFLKK